MQGRSYNSVIPNGVFVLLIANGLMFAAQIQVPIVNTILALFPIDSGYFMPWQVATYGFLHGDPMHILFNMFGLWMFGSDVERLMGTRRFLIYFMVCVVGAGIVQLIVGAMAAGNYPPTVGASGGVFGILLAYGLAFPNRTVMLLFPPIPMKARTFVIVFGIFELFMGVSGRQPGIANFAHLGGMVFGYLLIRHWSKTRRR